jgi:hypothetical protein
MRQSHVMGCWNDTVKQALAVDGSLRYQRTPLESILDAVQPRFPRLLWMASRAPPTQWPAASTVDLRRLQHSQ